MQIPRRFKLQGHTINVLFDNQLLHKDDNRGAAVYRRAEIHLQPISQDNPIPQSYIEEAFLHELTHFIFHAAGYEEDRVDEAKVWRFSHLLHQALTTMEYD